MAPSDVIPHLTASLRYTMGRQGDLPFVGNAFSLHVARPLVLSGVVPLKKYLDLPRPERNGTAPERDESLETLHAVLVDYLAEVETGALLPLPHTWLGELDVDGWARFHVIHFDHHMKQFNL